MKAGLVPALQTDLKGGPVEQTPDDNGGSAYSDCAAAAWFQSLGGANSKKSSRDGKCQGVEPMAQGFLEKGKYLGDVSIMSDNLYGFEEGLFNKQLLYMLVKKIKNGQPWTIWIDINGTSFFQANSGVLINIQENQKSASAAAGMRAYFGPIANRAESDFTAIY
jgi:hypothetical protein